MRHALRLMCQAAVAAMLLIASAKDAQSQNQIRGRIRDENSLPVSFAQVHMSPGDRRVVADRNGEFVLGSLQTGDYELTIRRIGYQPTQLNVHVPSDEGWIPITMTSIPRLLDSVRIRERGSLRYTALSPQCIHGSRSRGVRVSPEGLDRNTRVTDAGLVRARS